MSSNNNQMPDDLNPEFIFSLTANKLLGDIAKGIIDPVALAKKELANRGYDENGKWVGFKKSNS